MRTLEGVAGMLEEQGVTQEIIQAVEKAEITVQENVTKSLSAELVNAETNVAKSTKTVSGSKATQELENISQKTLQSIKDILKDAVPGEVTSGKARQYIKNGCYEDAIKDFYSLNPSNVKKIPRKEGLLGTLPDGRSINVRLESTYTTSIPTTEIMKSCNTAPTIEIMKPGGHGTRIKIRYENKL